jgi:non-specific protein-tyrosine kinase
MNLVTLTTPTSPAAEAYRTLRTNLHFASLETPLKTMVVASPDVAESGAEALANLAVTLAQSGKRVIAVDANLRQPVLHTWFGLQNGAGLAELLASAEAAANLQATSVNGLSLLSAGQPPAIPSDAISSNRMSVVIQSLVNAADMVLFNVPPAATVSDAAILSSQVDGVLLVISTGRTHREHAQQAKDAFLRAKARLLGAVMLNAR